MPKKKFQSADEELNAQIARLEQSKKETLIQWDKAIKNLPKDKSYMIYAVSFIERINQIDEEIINKKYQRDYWRHIPRSYLT